MTDEMAKVPTDEGFSVVLSPDGSLICKVATPVCWFPAHELDRYTQIHGHRFLSREGDQIRLTADNGTWIWQLTGRKYVHHYGPGTTPLVLCEGRWPD